MELGEDYGATVKGVDDLTKCMDLVKSGGVDATIFKRQRIVHLKLSINPKNLHPMRFQW